MDFDERSIVIEEGLDGLLRDGQHEYVAHAYCTAGGGVLEYNEQRLTFSEGDLLILPTMKLVQAWHPQEGFRGLTVFLRHDFRQLCVPRSNYGVVGSMSLMLNPVLHLEGWEREVCRQDFENIAFRHRGERNVFFADVMQNAVQALILDCYQFHASRNEGRRVSALQASVMGSFIRMLEGGAYREHRDLAFYASELCLSTKYFSDLCKRTTGYAASACINRYVVIEAKRLLNDTDMTIAEMSERLGFSSPSHFTRFFFTQTELLPSEYRR